jgi:LPXTG-motif cell wall-anchored protein
VFTLGKLGLAVLIALGMSFMWSGTATAEDPPPLPECLMTAPDPTTCLAADHGADGEAEGGTGDGGVPGAGAGDGIGGAEAGGDGTGDTTGDTTGDATGDDAGNDAGGGEGAGTGGASEEGTPADPLDLPDCETPADLPDCLPDCADDVFAQLPICEDEPPPLPPCESDEDLPLCIPDCEFIAGLLGVNGCADLPDCLDVSELPAEFLAVLEQLPQEILEQLPFCEEQEPPVENPVGEEPPPGATPVGNQETHYEDCDDARAHGAAPVFEGEPGYGPHLDSDDDGIGCEDDTVVPVAHDTGGGQLAYTGAELAPQLTLGGVLLLLGSGLLVATRRRA